MDPFGVRCVYFYGVEGLNGRYNDVLFRPSIPRICRPSTKQRTLVFFGGDVQNFLHLMDKDDPAIPYKSWCLEATAKKLAKDFPKHHIVIIRPSRIAFDHVSCYDNFVAGDILGTPKYFYHYDALPQLEMILMKISQKIRLTSRGKLYKRMIKKNKDFFRRHPCHDEELIKKKEEKLRKWLSGWQAGARLNIYPLTVVGFSKGCVVLNQFLYEFHYARRLEPTNQNSRFIDNIKNIYWLDASHAGRGDVYVTSLAPLKTLVDLDIEIQNHVSHYQVEDIARPWIGREWLEFSNGLALHSARQSIFIHKKDVADVHAHFDVLSSFVDENHRRYEMYSRPRPRPRRALSEPEPEPEPAIEPAPAPAPAARPAARARDDVVLSSNILGIALIKPHCNPYFGIQVILRRPMREVSLGRVSRDANGVVWGVRGLVRLAGILRRSGRLVARAPSAPPAPRRLHAPSGSAVPTHPPPSANAFTVIAKTKSARIDFRRDPEAAERYHNPKFYSTRAPRLATYCEFRDKPGIQMYKPEKKIYVPTVISKPLLRSFENPVLPTPSTSPLMMFEVLPGRSVPRPATLASAPQAPARPPNRPAPSARPPPGAPVAAPAPEAPARPPNRPAPSARPPPGAPVAAPAPEAPARPPNRPAPSARPPPNAPVAAPAPEAPARPPNRPAPSARPAPEAPVAAPAPEAPVAAPAEAQPQGSAPPRRGATRAARNARRSQLPYSRNDRSADTPYNLRNLR